MLNILGPAAQGIGQGLQLAREREAEEERRRQQAVLFELDREARQLELQLARADLEDAETIRPLRKRLNVLRSAAADLMEALPAQAETAQPTEGLPGAQPTGFPPITGGMPTGGVPQRPGPATTPNLMQVLGMGGAGGAAPQLPLLMPGFGAGARPGVPRRPIQIEQPAGAGRTVHPLIANLFQQAALEGTMTPETLAQSGMIPEEQLPPHMRREMGLERTPVAAEEWALTRYATLSGIDREDLKLQLSLDEFEHRKKFDAKEFDEVPERVKQGWAHDMALAELQRETELQVEAMPGRGGGGAAPEVPAMFKEPTRGELRTVRRIEQWYGGLFQAAAQDMPLTLPDYSETGDLVFKPSGIYIRKGQKPWDLMTPAMRSNARLQAEEAQWVIEGAGRPVAYRLTPRSRSAAGGPPKAQGQKKVITKAERAELKRAGFTDAEIAANYTVK